MDLCKDLGRLTALPDTSDVLSSARRTMKAKTLQRYAFHNVPTTFTIFAGATDKPIAKGTFGQVWAGEFGDGPNSMQKCIVKTQKYSAEVVKEIMVQTKLFCELRRTGGAGPGTATIPKPLFAALESGTCYIGMARAELSISKYLKKQRDDLALLRDISANLRAMDPSTREYADRKDVLDGLLAAYPSMRADPAAPGVLCATIRDVFLQLCPLLSYLQANFQFMHGDMHGGNVMVTTRPFRVYLIDYGFSSADLPGFSERTYSSKKYKDKPFDRSLDLLMQAESIAQGIGYDEPSAALAHRMLMTINGGVWNRVLKQKCTTGDKAECRILQKLRTAPRSKFHCFYDNALGMNHERTMPEKLVEFLKAEAFDASGAWRPSVDETGFFIRSNGTLAYHMDDAKTAIGKSTFMSQLGMSDMAGLMGTRKFRV